MIDVVGVILGIEELGQIQLKNTGEMRDRRQIALGDESGLSMMATLWGDLAKNEKVQIGTVMAIKGAKVSDYGGKSLNISDSQCHIEFNPKSV